MDAHLKPDERYWKDRAEELRLLAASVHHAEDRELFLRMAASYIKVAEWARRGGEPARPDPSPAPIEDVEHIERE